MKTFKCSAAQGDLVLTRTDAALPSDAHPIVTEGLVVLAHSETGHHHAIAPGPGIVELFGTSDPLKGYLRVRDRPVELKHYRAFDTHESLEIPPGLYEIHRQREWSPEGWRKVED